MNGWTDMSDEARRELAREELLHLERRLALEGAPAYEELLHRDALVVVPGAVLNKDECIAAIAASPPWDRIGMEPFWHFETGDTASIAYRFTGSRGSDEYEAVMLSGYLLENGLPRLIHHQQTQEPG